MNYDDLMVAYAAKKVAPGYVTIRVRDNKLRLVVDNVYDKGWKSRFFFVEKASLGRQGKNFVDGWNESGILFVAYLVF